MAEIVNSIRLNHRNNLKSLKILLILILINNIASETIRINSFEDTDSLWNFHNTEAQSTVTNSSLLSLKGIKKRKISKCDISKIEQNCELGAAFCRYDDTETCAKCRSNKILASPFYNRFRCVDLNLTLCSTETDCKYCDSEGQCGLCDTLEKKLISYDGVCV